MRKFRLLLAVAATVVASVAEGATASHGGHGTTHVVSSNNWRGLTFVLGIGSCDLFGAADPSFLVFRDVNLTDILNVSYTAFQGGPLYVFNSAATLHGVINTPDGPYKVVGIFTEQHNIRDPQNAFIATSGRAMILGPNGAVFGAARFQDLAGPSEFDVIFTSITACHLR